MARKRPPSIDFYYDDFYAGIADMHPLATGLYIKSICFQLAHDSLPDDVGKLRRITGATEAEFDQHWPDVRAKFESDGNGGLVNERAQREMEKKVRIREVRAENGKKGGRPSEANGKPNGSSLDKLKKPKRKREVGSRKSSRKKEYSAEFESFWSAYPKGRKEGKGKAWESWGKSIEIAEPDTIIAKAAEYAGSPKGRGEFVKLPTTWLNQRCWEDDPIAWQAGGENGAPARRRRDDSADFEMFRARLIRSVPEARKWPETRFQEEFQKQLSVRDEQ